MFKLANCSSLPEGKPPFSYGFPIKTSISYGFPMVDMAFFVSTSPFDETNEVRLADIDIDQKHEHLPSENGPFIVDLPLFTHETWRFAMVM